MAMSNWWKAWGRASQSLQKTTTDVLRMSGTDAIDRSPVTLFALNDAESVKGFATGCDVDIGGTSTVNFDLDNDPGRNAQIGKRVTAKFWGDMRLGMKPSMQGKMRSGYAAFRSKPRPTMFGGEDTFDLTFHRYLALRLRIGGDPRTRNSYYVNLQTESPVTNDLWQHRLYFHRTDGGWEDLLIPFQNFVLTNAGQIMETRVQMNRGAIRTVGISVLGGHTGVEGAYELGIDTIGAVNEEDIDLPPPRKEDEVLADSKWARGPM